MSKGIWIKVTEVMLSHQDFLLPLIHYKCSNCGKRVDNQEKYCPECGKEMYIVNRKSLENTKKLIEWITNNVDYNDITELCEKLGVDEDWFSTLYEDEIEEE